MNGNPTRAFLEERLTDFSERDKHNDAPFLSKVAQAGLAKGRQKQTPEAELLRSDVQGIWNYLKKEDIPDLQICLAKRSNGEQRLFVIDPGDPVSSGTYVEKHREWVQTLGKSRGMTLA